MAVELEMRSPTAGRDNQAAELFGQTPSQTVGPFFHYGLSWEGGADLLHGAPPDASIHGEVIHLRGRVLDGEGVGVPDAMLEIWQANAAGRYCSTQDARQELPLDPHFTGFGRTATGPGGDWQFRTLRPGRVPGLEGALQSPHIAVSVFGRGLLKRLATRIYFDGCAENETDAVLTGVPADRRATLLATRRDDIWWFDIVLQGPRETVFFAL
jgi:protocatechuate 3,4-dioxygenase alpha subunit